MEPLKNANAALSRLLCLLVGEKSVDFAVSDRKYIFAHESPLSLPYDISYVYDYINCLHRIFPEKKNDLHLMVGDAIESLGLQMPNLIKGLCVSGKFKGIKYTYWDKSLSSKVNYLIMALCKI
ncbi:hypothetical protein Ddye_009282 [Dipteronia dyeriana]|uniref:Uncharacterized protein n=1 Tax=Dipteronia dyeriana TaxID=168575 RepID=A0AAE0CM43_9ROSI|nr:hypothetical protein Ddye_009282 [Dipteronia dyeriana]